MKTLWQRFVSRHRRIMREVRQLQLEMAQENPRIGPLIFPKRPYKISTVIMFWVFMFFVAAACWVFIKELIYSTSPVTRLPSDQAMVISNPPPPAFPWQTWRKRTQSSTRLRCVERRRVLFARNATSAATTTAAPMGIQNTFLSP